jgi:hypothetical protein
MVPKLILANFLCSAVENIGENLSFHKLLNGQQSGPLTEKSANKINFYSTSRMRKLLMTCPGLHYRAKQEFNLPQKLHPTGLKGGTIRPCKKGRDHRRNSSQQCMGKELIQN